MTFPNDRPRTDGEIRNSTVRSDGSMRGQRPMGGWIIGALALVAIAVAVMFLLPNRNNTTASNSTSGPSSTMNSGSSATDPARNPASTTGAGSTMPTQSAPTTAPTTPR